MLALLEFRRRMESRFVVVLVLSLTRLVQVTVELGHMRINRKGRLICQYVCFVLVCTIHPVPIVG